MKALSLLKNVLLLLAIQPTYELLNPLSAFRLHKRRQAAAKKRLAR